MASKTLTTQQEQELFEASKEKLVRLMNGGFLRTDEQIVEDFKKLYRLCEWHDNADVMIVDSPEAAQALAKKELEQTSDDPVPYSTYINFSDKGWMTYFEVLKKYYPDEVTAEEEENVKFLDAITDGGFACILFEDGVIVPRYPTKVLMTDEFQLHATAEPALQFRDGTGIAFVRGRKMDSNEFRQCLTIEGAREYFFNTSGNNEDKKAMCLDIVKSNHGPAGVFEMLQAEVVDEVMVAHDTGQVETLRLFKTKEPFSVLSDRYGNLGQPYCWVQFTCPSTGFEYLIDCSADFTSAVEAAKWLRPNYIPMELEYNWTSFRN